MAGPCTRLGRCALSAAHAFFILLWGSVIIVGTVDAATAEQWRGRTIYQLLTDRFAQAQDPSSTCSNLKDYCGGTFKGIEAQLDYIQGMGFDAIWISPIPDQTAGGYHGYFAHNLYAINSHFGTAQDLKDLVQACHARGMYVMLDVVANHMGYEPSTVGDFSSFVPFNSSSHYHSVCTIANWSNQTEVEYCRLSGLPDLDQSSSYVASTLCAWINDTITTYGIDGIRIDTVPEVHATFWAQYAKAAAVFTMGEVDNGDPAYNAPYQGVLDATLDYPMYWSLRHALQEKGTMAQIQQQLDAESKLFKDIGLLGLFLDNHDNPRFLNINGDTAALLNALAYVLTGTGIPIVYYGTEAGFNGGADPGCREALWPHYGDAQAGSIYAFLKTVNAFRHAQGSALYAAPQVQRYADAQFYAFTRGTIFVAISNVGSSGNLQRTITYHPYAEGTVLVNILNAGDLVTVSGGSFAINIVNGIPKIYHPK
eukprot:Opistho-2@96975